MLKALTILFLTISNLAFADDASGFTPHKPTDFIKSLDQDPETGKKVYQAFCGLCHDIKPSIPVGAPRFGVMEDWAKRMGKGLDEIYKNLDEGIGAMPARGGCFECTDEMLKSAMIYMMPEELLKNE